MDDQCVIRYPVYDANDHDSSCDHAAKILHSCRYDDDSNEYRCEMIHSGQFMKSYLHQQEDSQYRSTIATSLNADDRHPRDGREEERRIQDTARCYAESNVSDSCRPAFNPSLSNHGDDVGALVTKISSIYCTRFSSPKWNEFKGVSLHFHEKVRLNNIIWREWNRQFVLGQRPILCEFTCPVDDPIHCKPQAVVLEGKYWKRKYDAVTEEYHQWRTFWKMNQPLRWTSTSDSPDEPDDFQASNFAASQYQQWTPDGYWQQPLFDQNALTDTWIPSSSYPSNRWKQDISDRKELLPELQAADADYSRAVFILNQPRHMDLDLDLVKGIHEISYPTGVMPEQPPVGHKVGVNATDCVGSESSQIRLYCSQGVVDDLEVDITIQQTGPFTTPTDAHRYRQHSPRFAVPIPVAAVGQFSCLRTVPASFSANQREGVSSSKRKRRTTVLDNIDILMDILPVDRSEKLSKAKMLEHAAAYCKELRMETQQLDSDLAPLKWNLSKLQRELSNSQMALPTCGTATQSAAFRRNRELFNAWVCERSSENCKFALFAELIAPLFDSFMASVCVHSSEELFQSVLLWQSEHCSLEKLHQSVMSTLACLGKSTSVLTSPTKFPEELRVRAWSNESSTSTRFDQQRLS